MSRNIARNWDIAVTSSALLLIVGGIAMPHLKRLIDQRGHAAAPDALGVAERVPAPAISVA